jgi:hypothetical protein
VCLHRGSAEGCADSGVDTAEDVGGFMHGYLQVSGYSPLIVHACLVHLSRCTGFLVPRSGFSRYTCYCTKVCDYT